MEDGEISYWLKTEEFEKGVNAFYLRTKNAMSGGRPQIIQDIDGREAKVYNPSLYLILSSESYPAYNKETGEECQISTYKYFTSFCLGFYEGEQYFTDNYAVTSDVLYGENSSKYIDTLRSNYFEIIHDNSFTGWVGIKDWCPEIVSNGKIKRFGYYSGIVSQVEELVNKHPAFFEGFIGYSKPLIINKKGINTIKPEPILVFEDLFLNPLHAEPCLSLLKKLTPPFVSEDNRWIGNSKGIFRLWVDILVLTKGRPIIKPEVSNTAIASIMMTKIIGLKLTASEMGKIYKRLPDEKIKKEMKVLLSQLSILSVNNTAESTES